MEGGDGDGGDGKPVVPLKWNNADAAGVQKANRESTQQGEVRQYSAIDGKRLAPKCGGGDITNHIFPASSKIA